MEDKKDEEDSTLNEGEAEVAIAHAKRLVESGVRASDIGLITPYAAQVSVINNKKTKLVSSLSYTKNVCRSFS